MKSSATTNSFAILMTIVISAFIHLISFFLAQTLLKDWRGEHVPLHSAIEVFGGAIALFVAYLLIQLNRSGQGTSFNIVIASAFAVMGVVDIAHALVQPGELFVWLHSVATFFGGVVFLFIYLPRNTQKKLPEQMLWWCLLLSVVFVITSITFEAHLPSMLDEGRFSSIALGLNIVGGGFLILCAIRLYAQYLKTRNENDLLFILHSSLFGLAAIMFQSSTMWDVSWWGWHLLRMLAYGVALWFALKSEISIFSQIEQANRSLSFKAAQTDMALHEIQQRFAFNEKQQAAILSCLADAIVVTDVKGNIRSFSDNAEIMFGYSAEQVVGKNIICLMESDIGKMHHHYMAGYQSKTSSTVVGKNRELKAKRNDGEAFPIDLTINEVVLNDERHFVGVIRDISERKAQEQLLYEAKEQADAANAAKSAFLANTSHEIRTPLNGVYGNLQLLMECELPPKALNYVENALYSSKALMVLINDILDFSKIEAGKLQIEHTPFRLSQLLEGIKSDMGREALAKHLSFNLNSTVPHDCWVGDAFRIRQVLLNMISNAVKFTKEGEVTVATLYAEGEGHLTFVVKDTGIGMSTDTVGKLFSRFDQADVSTTRQFGGTGIGMSITHSLVTMMGGQIKVYSELGKGSTFIVKLPLEQASFSDLPDYSIEKETVDFSGKRILLAEDNEINQAVVEGMLASTGCELIIVGNGKEAVETIKEDVDLILMDVQMPIMDGVEATKLVRQSYPLLPVVALTANVMESDRQRYSQAGFSDCLGKPVEKHDLLAVLQNYL